MAPPEIRAVLLDIEGTTTPIDFVYRTLFPHARENVEPFLVAHHNEPEVADILAILSSEQDEDVAAGNNPPPWEMYNREEEVKSAAKYVQWLMDQDRKSTGLKALQGMIWKDGYESGTLKGVVYPDVVEALKQWRERDIWIWIFSSGSILAQKLLFRYCENGDLTKLLDGHFDTTTGPKLKATSYTSIAEKIGIAPNEILFISDVVEELDAADKAGMKTLLSIRPGNKPQPEHSYPTISNFKDIL
ncbi:MAG: acireductone synthase [Candidatus Sumerlaeia bacterium]|nr:acireductone synthase [Candidatus Sumerlaeia bacterium]